MGVIAGVLILAALAIVIGITWAPSWGAILSKPLTSAFDGGDEEPEQKPIYSPAEAKRKRGQYREAVDEIRKELQKFPNDFHGQMMLAEIQAENLNDMQGAQITIERIISQPGHMPANIASALHALADWHLKFGQDPASAREALQKIEALLPNTQFSQVAAQRIAHLSTVEQLIDSHDRKTIELGTYEQFIGLQKSQVIVTPKAEEKPETAVDLVKHLQTHPLDTDAREKLAQIYAEQYKRVDMAKGELDQLIAQPQRPIKSVVRWINMIADFQLKYAGDLAGAEKTIRRIIDLAPKTAYAQQAENRIAYLKLEVRTKEKSQPIQVGSYEKDLGLKLAKTFRSKETEDEQPQAGQS